MKLLLLLFLNFGILLAVYPQASKVNATKDKNYPFKKGNLLLNKENVKMNYIKNTEIRLDTLRVKNGWTQPMVLGHKPSPPYMSLVIKPDTLEVGQEGMVVLAYDAAKKNDYGYSYENMTLLTNDDELPEKFFFVMAYIEEDFSGLSKEALEEAPRIKFKEEMINFGVLKQGETVKKYFEFTNIGKSDLIIRRVKASCGCTATEPEKTLLKPGESSRINVVFDSKGLSGEQHKTVHVYCNDPRYGTVALHLKGEVK